MHQRFCHFDHTPPLSLDTADGLCRLVGAGACDRSIPALVASNDLILFLENNTQCVCA